MFFQTYVSQSFHANTFETVFLPVVFLLFYQMLFIYIICYPFTVRVNLYAVTHLETIKGVSTL